MQMQEPGPNAPQLEPDAQGAAQIPARTQLRQPFGRDPGPSERLGQLVEPRRRGEPTPTSKRLLGSRDASSHSTRWGRPRVSPHSATIRFTRSSMTRSRTPRRPCPGSSIRRASLGVAAGHVRARPQANTTSSPGEFVTASEWLLSCARLSPIRLPLPHSASFDPRHMHRDLRLSAVIPCYNEEHGIQEVHPPHAADRGRDRRGGQQLHRSAPRRSPGGSAPSWSSRRFPGYGAAYQAGLARAPAATSSSRWTATGPIRRRRSRGSSSTCSSAIGSSSPPAASRSATRAAMGLTNRIGNAVLTAATAVLFLKPIRDSQSGMWVFRRAAPGRLRPTSNGHGVQRGDQARGAAPRAPLRRGAHPLRRPDRRGQAAPLARRFREPDVPAAEARRAREEVRSSRAASHSRASVLMPMPLPKSSRTGTYATLTARVARRSRAPPALAVPERTGRRAPTPRPRCREAGSRSDGALAPMGSRTTRAPFCRSRAIANNAWPQTDAIAIEIGRGSRAATANTSAAFAIAAATPSHTRRPRRSPASMV